MTFGNVEQNFDEEGIRLEERNKVLDELEKWINWAQNTQGCNPNNCGEDSDCPCDEYECIYDRPYRIFEKIAELKKRGG